MRRAVRVDRRWQATIALLACLALFTSGTVPVYATAQFSVSSPRTATLGSNDTTSALLFVPITPCRVVDTRRPYGAFGGPKMAAATTRSFAISAGNCGVPETAEAYALNVTVVPSETLGFLTIWPAGQSRPDVSTLNSWDGRVKANAAIIDAGTGGAVSVYVSQASDVVLDIDGYFAPARDSLSLAFYPAIPCRVADTRTPTGPFGGPYMSAGQTRSFAISASACNIPATAEAYSLNFTVVPRGTFGFLTAWPTGQPLPDVSTLNAFEGQVTANSAIVPAGSAGAISLYVSHNADVVIDINGYFAPEGNGGLALYSLRPCRALDSRSSGTKKPFVNTIAINIAGSGCGIPATAEAVVTNATVLPSTVLGFLSLWANSQAEPHVSTLNSSDGATVSNLAIVPTYKGLIDAHASNLTHLVVDVSGYFGTIALPSSTQPFCTENTNSPVGTPIPLITSATTTITAGVNASLTIAGTGFAPTAQVILGNTCLSVRWISSTLLVADSGLVQPPAGGVLALQVADPGWAASNVVTVGVQNSGTRLSYAAARRFLEQATWGSTPASIQHLQDIGVDAWLNEQFDSIQTPASTYAPPFDDTSSLDSLQKQFFENAVAGLDQLRQRVAFALGQIAVVSGLKLNTYNEMMPYQQLLLNDAFGKYSDFIKDVTLSPAMGHYLDMVNNDVPTAKSSPDENYARESMQLFTIGLSQLDPGAATTAPPMPTFTQDDVRSLARVLTGWTYAPCLGSSKWPNPPCFLAPMVAIEAHHDNTAKQFLGTTIATGSAEGDLDLALATIESYHGPEQTMPNIAPFIAQRLIQHLVTGNPDPAYVARVSAVFASSGGDLKQVVRAILEDSAAGYGNDGAALANDQGHLREPVVYAISLLRALGASILYDPSLAVYTTGMGQNLFYSSSVFNYYSPLYALPGTATVAPEFQLLAEPTAFAAANYAYRTAHNQISSDITIDFSNFSRLASDTNPATQIASLTAMLNAVSQALLGAPMSSGMLGAIMPAMLATINPTTRVQNAVFLVAASPQYQVVH